MLRVNRFPGRLDLTGTVLRTRPEFSVGRFVSVIGSCEKKRKSLTVACRTFYDGVEADTTFLGRNAIVALTCTLS